MRKTTANTGFASGGVTCKLGALCLYQSRKFSGCLADPAGAGLRNPPQRQAENVMQHFKMTPLNLKTT